MAARDNEDMFTGAGAIPDDVKTPRKYQSAAAGGEWRERETDEDERETGEGLQKDHEEKGLIKPPLHKPGVWYPRG